MYNEVRDYCRDSDKVASNQHESSKQSAATNDDATINVQSKENLSSFEVTKEMDIDLMEVSVCQGLAAAWKQQHENSEQNVANNGAINVKTKENLNSFELTQEIDIEIMKELSELDEVIEWEGLENLMSDEEWAMHNEILEMLNNASVRAEVEVTCDDLWNKFMEDLHTDNFLEDMHNDSKIINSKILENISQAEMDDMLSFESD